MPIDTTPHPSRIDVKFTRMLHPFSLTKYLERIGIEGPVQPDLTTLVALHAAQVATIPFEDLDPFLGRPVSLDLPSLEEKLLFNRRYKLVDNRLIIEARDGVMLSEELIHTAQAFGRVLDQTFLITPPVPVQDIFARFKTPMR